MSYFPMFIELSGKKCLVVGDSSRALRKVQIMEEFGANVAYIPTDKFEVFELEGMELVVAAADSKLFNHWIAEACKKRNIPVNAVDQIEDCTFIFPSYVKEGEVVAAFSSGGTSPLITQYLKKSIKPILTEQLGELSSCLGNLRETVKECVKTEEERKAVFQELLDIGLERAQIPTEKEIEDIIEKHKD